MDGPFRGGIVDQGAAECQRLGIDATASASADAACIARRHRVYRAPTPRVSRAGAACTSGGAACASAGTACIWFWALTRFSARPWLARTIDRSRRSRRACRRHSARARSPLEKSHSARDRATWRLPGPSKIES